MSVIIALEGKPSKGKSATINLLFNLMNRSGFKIFQNKKRANSHDFFAIFEKNGKKIGVTSYGDNVELLRGKYEIFVNKGCTILVSASRPDGSIKALVDNYPGFSTIHHTKTLVDDIDIAGQRRANEDDAQSLLEMIESNL